MYPDNLLWIIIKIMLKAIKLIILLMNPNYSSPRHFPPGYTANNLPFYNPIKQPNPPVLNSPGFPKSPNNAHFLPGSIQANSKSYVVKPNYQPIKNIGNNSGYLKSGGQTNIPSSNYNGYNPMFSKTTSDMVKSSFHDPQKINNEMPNLNYLKNNEIKPNSAIMTPPRRQPRFSQPAIFQNSLETTHDTKSNFIPLAKKEVQPPKEQNQQVNFYKKNLQNEVQKQEKQPNRQWLRQSNKKKKITLQNFQMIRNLGKGKYGQVYLAKQKKSGYICALKVIEKQLLRQEQIIEQFLREIKIQMFLNHPNIIKLYGFFDDQKNIYIILEVAMGGQLFEQLKRSEPMPQAKVAHIMKQICTAVDQIHSCRIIHRDLKPQNIVMHEGIVKLCDFGWSVHLDNKMRTTFCGTPLYVCPQILKGNEYDQKIDIWSLGIMMYEMLVGQNPFKINREQQLIKIVKDQISIPSYVYVSREARDFLDKCLQKNPLDRVTIKLLVNHQFILKNAEKQKQKKLNL